jgi:protocatechuate 3,4-dioxygenase beta subunit
MGTHDEHREGLAHDLPAMQAKGMVARPRGRRSVLGLVGGVGAIALVGCGSDRSSSAGATAPGGTPPAEGAPPGGPGGQPPGGGFTADQGGLDAGDIPVETAGPFPGDGSNGVDVLSASGIVRRDIRSSFGDATGTAGGVPMRIRLTVLDNSGEDVTPYAGAAVYIWHCDREGRYSLYSDGVTEENYLRGVQTAADDGSLEFLSVFPACYTGRWPHLHVEVYGSVDDATTASNKLRTTQIALPADVCGDVYDHAEGYEASRSSFAGVSLDTDGVFSDGHSLQMARLIGSIDEGYTLQLRVPV